MGSGVRTMSEKEPASDPPSSTTRNDSGQPSLPEGHMGHDGTTAADRHGVYKYILVITDVFTIWAEAIPLHKTDAEALATVFVNEVVSGFGVPSQLHSDQGANFCAEVINAMCRQLGIERSRYYLIPSIGERPSGAF